MNTTLGPSLSVSQWLSFPWPVRRKFVEVFSIPRSEGAHVQIGGPESSHTTSDGHSHKDLQVITVEKMQEYLKTEEKDFFVLIEKMVAVFEGVERESAEVIAKRMEDEKIARWTNLLAAMKLEAKELNLQDRLDNLLSLSINNKPPHVETPTVSAEAPRRGRPKKTEGSQS